MWVGPLKAQTRVPQNTLNTGGYATNTQHNLNSGNSPRLFVRMYEYLRCKNVELGQVSKNQVEIKNIM